MTGLEELLVLLRERGAEFKSSFNADGTPVYVMLYVGPNRYMFTSAEKGRVLANLTPRQVVMATLGSDGCPMAMSGTMRCEAPCDAAAPKGES